MADVNRGNRPLSPHLTIYRPQITSVLSIFHRVTGAGMMVTAVLVTWWFLAAATSPEYFAIADGFLTSWFGILVMALSALGFWYHFFNGLRHIVWDLGYGFEMEQVTQSAYVVMGLAALMTIITLIAA